RTAPVCTTASTSAHASASSRRSVSPPMNTRAPSPASSSTTAPRTTSSARTRCPPARSRWATCEPMRPPAPVISTSITLASTLTLSREPGCGGAAADPHRLGTGELQGLLDPALDPEAALFPAAVGDRGRELVHRVDPDDAGLD